MKSFSKVFRDFVPLFDKMGREICQDTIVRLSPHPDAPFHDHGFQNKTYEKAIKREFDRYINEAKLW